MDREKLNEAAMSAANDIAESYDPDFPELSIRDLRDECFNSFCNGANWLMQQPLSFRLTEEEKEKIKKLYVCVESMFDMLPEGHVNQRRIIKAENILIGIFGPDLFTEK